MSSVNYRAFFVSYFFDFLVKKLDSKVKFSYIDQVEKRKILWKKLPFSGWKELASLSQARYSPNANAKIMKRVIMSPAAHTGLHNGLHIGLDIGSTTVKVVLLDADCVPLYTVYRRHLSDVRSTVAVLLRECLESQLIPENQNCTLNTSGSGAIALAEDMGLGFVQEVAASAISIRRFLPDVDVTIELGGEDAKITFFTGGVEQRMNETCAGGTGAFIDQMAAFLNTDAAGLNTLAANHHNLYPIASRCGVFAKSDILPLLNEGCRREDIAASIFQAVVDQCIGGLACGREIKGKVAFLGGPLAFLPSLRARFVDSLTLTEEEAIFPNYAEYFVAMGAALYQSPRQESAVQAKSSQRLWSRSDLMELVHTLETQAGSQHAAYLPPLFENEDQKKEFEQRHAQNKVVREDIANVPPGLVYLGIDSGSTTIKATLIDGQGRLLYSSYQPSQGEPLLAAVNIVRQIYALLPEHIHMGGVGVTGYGSALLRAALRADLDEVETLAHCKAARFFLPGVSFILDIGGQDIKCIHVRDGCVHRIQLNEACSAGCGSFVETFAKSLNMDLELFVEEALHARHPVDLGSRCTVFMNSRVKQAQKEGASIGDIAAGLSYSVIKNALYKVIKISSPAELGEHIIAQGGSFYNDALLRALELSLQRPVVRLDIAGLMGAFGVALLARDHMRTQTHSSTLLNQEEIAAFKVESTVARCQHCSNHCQLTVSRFADGTRFISGNRCQRGAGKGPNTDNIPNLFAYKYQRLFHYEALPLEQARGVVGIPRVLNLYENYPLWFTLFTKLGFRVELSAPSSKQIYNQGLSSIPSQSVCYPAKLAHGHLLDLLQRRVDFIFYPCLPYERVSFTSQTNHYNCPVVSGYPELLRNNMDGLRERIPYYYPFLPLEPAPLIQALKKLPPFESIALRDVKLAVDAAFAEQDAFHADMRAAGEKALATLEARHTKGIILAGHPYHIDPEVNHGIPELITGMGLAVLTEDSVAHLTPVVPLRVVDQWTYHARLYRAAAFSVNTNRLALVQLISFGCGLDAITADQVEEIISRSGKLYTQIKIDEGANLGAARIRIRSLVATLRDESEQNLLESKPHSPKQVPQLETPEPVFTEAMRATHTLLIPQMAPIHFQFIEKTLCYSGYKAALLPKVEHEAVEYGLRRVNNDACYPAIMVIGQLLHALEHGYDPNHVALMISQTGGGCRATNYISFLRKALIDSGLGHVPIVAFNTVGLTKQPGFKVDLPLLERILHSCIYGDVLMRMLLRVRPYEKIPGSAQALTDAWIAKASTSLNDAKLLPFYRNIRAMIRDFDALPLRDLPRKPQVGLVGEILLKFHPDANNAAVEVLEAEGGEAVMPDLLDFYLYCLHDTIYRHRHLGGSLRLAAESVLSLAFVLSLRWPARRLLKASKRFSPPLSFHSLLSKSRDIVSLGQQTGEGWLLTAEMVELLETGVPNILCMQPFGCLPNHITGKGVLKELKRRFPEANIAAVDYDPGASEVNQINRIKLLMSGAKKNVDDAK